MSDGSALKAVGLLRSSLWVLVSRFEVDLVDNGLAGIVVVDELSLASVETRGRVIMLGSVVLM